MVTTTSMSETKTLPQASREDAESYDLVGRKRWILWAVLGLAAIVQVYAGLELLGLRWDGGPFLRNVISTGNFVFYEPPRLMAQVILEWPAVIAMRLGITDTATLAKIWSVNFQLAPLLLTSATYLILPSHYKILFAFPVFHYFAGASSVGSAGMLEGPTATAYFWIVFFLVLFAPERRNALILTTIVAIPTIFLHEVMSLLAPILAYAAWWRSNQVAVPTSRLFFRILIGLFVVATAAQIGHVVFPTYVKHRGYFIDDFIHLYWLFQGQAINPPAAGGLLAGISILAVWRFPKQAPWIVIAFGLAAVGLLGWARGHGVATQFPARNHPAIISIPLAIMLLVGLRWPHIAFKALSRHAVHGLTIIAILATVGLAAQIVTVRYWAFYITAVRETLLANRGFIVWEDFLARFPPDQARLLARSNFDWVNPDLSLLLSPTDTVRSLLLNPEKRWGGDWQPWDPTIRSKRPIRWSFDPAAFPTASESP